MDHENNFENKLSAPEKAELNIIAKAFNKMKLRRRQEIASLLVSNRVDEVWEGARILVDLLKESLEGEDLARYSDTIIEYLEKSCSTNLLSQMTFDIRMDLYREYFPRKIEDCRANPTIPEIK